MWLYNHCVEQFNRYCEMSLRTKQHVSCLHLFVKLWSVFTIIANRRGACSSFPACRAITWTPRRNSLLPLVAADSDALKIARITSALQPAEECPGFDSLAEVWKTIKLDTLRVRGYCSADAV